MHFFLTLLVSMSLLVGCASVPQEPKPLLEGVKSVTVIAPREPWAYTVMSFVDLSLGLGSWDFEVSVGSSKEKQVLLTEMLKRKNFNFTSEFISRIVDRLRQEGYQVILQDSPWVQVDDSYQLNFAAIQSKTDVALVVAPTVMGMVSPSGTSSYVPTITAVATLLPRDKSHAPYKGFFATGWRPSAKGWQFAPAEQNFDTFDDVLDRPDAAVASFKQAGATISNLVVNQLLTATRP